MRRFALGAILTFAVVHALFRALALKPQPDRNLNFNPRRVLVRRTGAGRVQPDLQPLPGLPLYARQRRPAAPRVAPGNSSCNRNPKY